MLSGFAFPIRNMPLVVQYLSYLNPLRYFIEIVRGIFLKGVGVSVLWPQTAYLADGKRRDSTPLEGRGTRIRQFRSAS